jgi:hypothetical protein
VLRAIVALAAALWAGWAFAADQPVYAPPPAWVKAAPAPGAPTAADGASAVKVLLIDNQTRFGPDGDEFYTESVFRIDAPAGLAILGQISPSWDPQTETLTLHRFDIRRGAQVIDLLDGGKKVTVVRREKNLELAMIDGDLTALIQPEGAQVGDVIDLAFTLTRRDPVLKGMSQWIAAIRLPGVGGDVRLRAVWPAAKAIRWRATDGTPTPVVRQTADGAELAIEAKDYEVPKPPAMAPPRFFDLDELEFTQFRDWAHISALMAPLYDKARTLAPGSPVKLEAAKIAAASPTRRRGPRRPCGWCRTRSATPSSASTSAA